VVRHLPKGKEDIWPYGFVGVCDEGARGAPGDTMQRACESSGNLRTCLATWRANLDWPGFLTTGLEGRGFPGCGKTRRDCHSEDPQAVLSETKEESRIATKVRRARFFASLCRNSTRKSFRFSMAWVSF